MKVVKRQSNGAFVYRSDPPFKKGFGIKNAVAMFGGQPEDYEELTVSQATWDANPYVQAQAEEAAIAAEMHRHAYEQAKIRLGLEEATRA